MIDTPKSQGQAKMLALAQEAFEATCNTILRGADPSLAQEGLRQALEGLRLATKLTEQLADVPEAATGDLAEQLKKPPVDQGALQTELLASLAETPDSQVGAWYLRNRARIEEVHDPKLRNKLYDAIRAR